MKSLILVVLLAAAATAAVVSNDYVDPEMIVTHEDVDVSYVGELLAPTAVASRRNLSVGTIGQSRLLARTTLFRAAFNGVHVVDLNFRTNRPITALRVRHDGTVQGSTTSIVAGGVGSNFVIIRFRSAFGRGFRYHVEVFGR